MNRACLILLYCALDTMAYLSMPGESVENTRSDFITWCDRYLVFEGNNKISGEEFYSARCGMLHSYTVNSRSTRSNKARKIVYSNTTTIKNGIKMPILPADDVVILSIEAFVEALSNGINCFLIDIYKEKKIISIFEERATELFGTEKYAESI